MRIDLDACEALSGANSNDMAVICLREAAAIDMLARVGEDVLMKCLVFGENWKREVGWKV